MKTDLIGEQTDFTTLLNWCDRIMEDTGVCWRNVCNLFCRGGGAWCRSDECGWEIDNYDDVEKRLHPSVLVDTVLKRVRFLCWSEGGGGARANGS